MQGMVDRAVEREEARASVLLVCPELRLRRMLDLMLVADGYEVVTWPGGGPLARAPGAIVVDLDGLHCRPPTAVALLRAGGVDTARPLLLISVYPPEGAPLDRVGPLDYLQPPFSPRELSERLTRLLRPAEPDPDRGRSGPAERPPYNRPGPGGPPSF
jgi:DNA-binding response OmpR family regulator